jgi:endo-1,4-beta-xylanase
MQANFLLLAATVFVGASFSWAADDEPTLKDAFIDDVLVGTAWELSISRTETRRCWIWSLRSLMPPPPKNCLKWAAVHPDEDRYNFEPADIYVEWGEFVIMTSPNSIELQSVMLMLV